MLKPDKVQFVNWSRASSTCWDLQCETKQSNGDSAVTVTWDEESLKPGEVREYVTYYGLSEFTSDLVVPIALSVSSDNKFTYEGYDYTVMGLYSYLQNIGDGDASNVEISIDLPEELELFTENEYFQKSESKSWDEFKVDEYNTCNWLLKVKDSYYETEDKQVDVIINLKYKTGLLGLINGSKSITKTITIPGRKYAAITSAGYREIVLDGVLGKDNLIDTDDDGIQDWDEINTDLVKQIKIVKNPDIITLQDLPKYQDVINYVLSEKYPKDKSTLFYVEDGFPRFAYSINNQYDLLVPILPLISDPTSEDSDGDGILDCLDNEFYSDLNIVDPNLMQYNKIDSYTLERINTLHPLVKKSMLSFVLESQLSVPNYNIRITDYYRTIEEQNELYELGRSKPGNIVTWAKGGYSYHNYGLAIDICFIDSEESAVYKIDLYNNIKQIYPKYNLEWGGEWDDKPDMPHYQMTFGYSTNELLYMYNTGMIDEKGYVIIEN